MTGLTAGFDTVAFAVAFGLMAVVIYDAMCVRAETGKQGAVLNRLLHEIVIEGKPITEEKLKELVGHTPLEVLGGVLVAVVFMLLLWRLWKGRHTGEMVLMLALMAYLVMENKPFLIAAHPLFLLLPCALLTPRGKPLNVVCPTDER